uniref:Uncharacterized protein n=1 Tax=Phytophthora ramorum TaxID=164328 RepID=H3GY91_PHYRM
MGDFLDVLELSGLDSVAKCRLPSDDTVFVCGGNGEMLWSAGVAMPLAAVVKARNEKKLAKLRLLHKWEKDIREDEAMTSDEEEINDLSSSEEDGRQIKRTEKKECPMITMDKISPTSATAKVKILGGVEHRLPLDSKPRDVNAQSAPRRL